ncbi:hypothetical protein DEO23_06840 [Brachybacterium endophyticum]|uniref:Uncharacterized protein n=1 Tax=Brachybacterium endophyticum TaxID=2182385 RepID=A0A2U2RLD9_9MICO|nr:hypothetical protein DEO23_06840 [Brachybacterium endophyticum]
MLDHLGIEEPVVARIQQGLALRLEDPQRLDLVGCPRGSAGRRSVRRRGAITSVAQMMTIAATASAMGRVMAGSVRWIHGGGWAGARDTMSAGASSCQ